MSPYNIPVTVLKELKLNLQSFKMGRWLMLHSSWLR